MRSKSFDFVMYMKPSISSIGYIQDKKNEFLKQSIIRKTSDKKLTLSRTRENTTETRIQRAFERSENLKVSSKELKRIERKGTAPFLVKGRDENNKRTDSPPPGRYTPQYDYLLKSSARVIFSKAKLPWDSLSRSHIRASSCDLSKDLTFSNDQDSKQRIKGIPFGKQSSRKSVLNESYAERSVLKIQNSSFSDNKAHKFGNYIPRKPLHRFIEHQPDYNPSYSFLSKPCKSNRIL